MRAAGSLTTSEMCTRVPDQPKATVYRQVERLVRGEVFEVESERQVRGAVERRYRLVPGGAIVDAEAARSMTADDHRRAFTAAMAALIADFNTYLDGEDASPLSDEVSYRHYTVWLRPGERSKLIREVSRILRALAKNEPGSRRQPYVLSTVFFPSITPGARPSKRRRARVSAARR